MKDFSEFYGILFGCPVGDRRQDCPLIRFENLSFKEKIQWFDKLSNEEKLDICKHHTECTDNR